MTTKTRGRPRRWTDDQLRQAVASQHSWHGVLRALGFASTSGNSLRILKKAAAAMKLDTSHFRGQRRWSDMQLREAVLKAASWTDVLRILELHDNRDSRTSIKAHSRRLGLDDSHLQPVLVDDEIADDLFLTGAQPSMLRTAASSVATAWFMLRGMSVAVPTEHEVYDLLVTTPDGVQRVQVKSSTCRTKSGSWQVGIGRRPYVLDKTAGKIPYDPDSIDYFFIVDGAGRIFLIPSRVLAGRKSIYIDSYAEYRVGEAASLLK